MSLALGARTFKLRFGHHGANHPVRRLATGRVEITSQNHNYAVEADSLGTGTVVTHLNLNDGDIEGVTTPDRRCFSVQYHPEAGPGPHDARYLFGEFLDLMREAS
jgi:carbamoyl-phosphate synthase small subunit